MLLPVMEAVSRFGDHEAGEDHADGVSGGGAQAEELAMQGGGAGVRDKPVKVIPCPRCQSMNTKFCYYNNYSVTQPRHFCRNCQRYWTVGGTLRNVPVGGGSRKKTRTRSRSDPYHIPAYDTASAVAVPPQSDSFLSGMQQLSMLPPPALGFMNFPGAAAARAPFLLDGIYPRAKPLAGLQEVPDMQSLFDAPRVPQIAPLAPPMLLNNANFFASQASFQPPTEPLASVMAKAGLWSQTPVDSPGAWDMDPQKKALQGGGYGHLLSESLKQQPGFWPAGVMDDRLVPHASWDDSNPSTTHNTPNLSPNGSSTTDSMANPGSTAFYYEDVSQPWAGILSGF